MARHEAADASGTTRRSLSVIKSSYGTRRCFISFEQQAGVLSLPALQRFLGHDRLTTTEIYLNLAPEEVLGELREKW
jgi:site-specific recombinase XerD